MKHGLTGAGVVMVSEDLREVEVRDEALQDELAPNTVMGRIMVREMAKSSIRMERAGRQETAAIAMNVRHATDDFEEGRIDEAERLLGILGDNPRTYVRKLRKSPEGIDVLIESWLDLRDALTHQFRLVWTPWHRERAENLAGFRIEVAEASRIFALSRAIWGDFSGLGDPEGGDLDDESRKAWARERLVERIDAEVADLEAHLQTIDFQTIATDRAQAGKRAMFDTSKEATLARRYEAEATRGFFKALRELRKVEAEFAAQTIEDESPDPEVDYGQLASFRDRETPLPRDPRPLDLKPLPIGDRPLQSPQLPTVPAEKPPFGPT